MEGCSMAALELRERFLNFTTHLLLLGHPLFLQVSCNEPPDLQVLLLQGQVQKQGHPMLRCCLGDTQLPGGHAVSEAP